MANITPAPPPRTTNKDVIRARIIDALIALLGEGRLDINHDLVAERAGVARRTVYRHFPDRETLLQAIWDQVREVAATRIVLPERESDLVDHLRDIYVGFDSIGPLVTLIRSTLQGRAIRMAANKRRTKTYTAVTADAVKGLPPGDRKLATALIQALHTTMWLELHDHWNLRGDEMARVIGWAMRTLLRDLHARDGQPLDSDV